MTFPYNHNFIQSLKSNLSFRHHMVPHISQEELEGSGDHLIFQILLYENQEFKLVYGKKRDIKRKYGIDPLSLGVEVDTDFVKKREIEYSTVFFLLKCRKLSQVLTATWLVPKMERKEIEVEKDPLIKQRELTREILDSYNIFPNDIYWLHNHKCELETVHQKVILRKLEKESHKYKFYCITPTHISYRSVSLVLLLCGQAYYKDNNAWTRICEPIFSTYETIWEYGLDISWDTYYATRIDVSQAGQTPVAPFTSVVLGYPAKPNQFSLTDDNIKHWVNSNEYDSGENKYPFYPDKESQEWKDKDLKYIVPPYPYMPLSCF